MHGSRGADRGFGPPLKNHQNIGFLSNTGRAPQLIRWLHQNVLFPFKQAGSLNYLIILVHMYILA